MNLIRTPCQRSSILQYHALGGSVVWHFRRARQNSSYLGVVYLPLWSRLALQAHYLAPPPAATTCNPPHIFGHALAIGVADAQIELSFRVILLGRFAKTLRGFQLRLCGCIGDDRTENHCEYANDCRERFHIANA